jgi:hypothetical protein
MPLKMLKMSGLATGIDIKRPPSEIMEVFEYKVSLDTRSNVPMAEASLKGRKTCIAVNIKQEI